MSRPRPMIKDIGKLAGFHEKFNGTKQAKLFRKLTKFRGRKRRFLFKDSVPFHFLEMRRKRWLVN